jgi:Tfp pilus assembly protein PilE
MRRSRPVSRDAGFTMIELLTILLVALVLALMSYPELAKYHIRSQIEGLARSASLAMQQARYRAMKDSQSVRICADTAKGEITGATGAADFARLPLPKTVKFEAPPSQTAIDVDGGCFVFQPDGSVEKPGAFRIADVRGNFLEVRVEPRATARVQVRKWDETDGKWYTRSQGGKAWEWKTGNLF